MKKYIKHFITVTRHKFYVMQSCFKAGLIWQGLMHDNSKYGLTEFISSAKHFQGSSSPIDKEKSSKGYSLAWQHHKGKNKHHWQYWTDFENGKLILLRIPPKYLIEMICDWVGAGKAYNKGKWSIDTFKGWYTKNQDNLVLHTSTRFYVDMLVENVKNEKDLYKSWLLKKRICENYTQDECEGCAYQPPIELNMKG